MTLNDRVSRPEYDVVMAQNLRVPMRDGVRLAADLYRPARGADPLPGAFPTLLVRTPYDKAGLPNRTWGDYFARRGYNLLVQDVRGRYASEGEFYLLAREAEDGYDTCAWLVAQPWCNGRIGTLGTSYLAWVQNALAALNPPGLAAMYVNQGGHNAYTSTVRHNGAFELRFYCWAYMGAATSPEAAANPLIRQALAETRARDWLTPVLPRPGQTPLALVPGYERWAFELLGRGEQDEFWRSPSLDFGAHLDATADVPIIFSSAWYDSYPRANLENFSAFRAAKRGPIRAIMGPWTHGGITPDRTWSGDVEFGPAASVAGSGMAESFTDHHLRFFDHYLKGLDNGFDAEPPLRLFVMGGGDGHRTAEGRLYHGGRWRDEQVWPLARTRFTPFYLAPGHLGPSRPEAAASASSFRFDPLDPVPTVGGCISSLSDFYPVPGEITERVPIEARWGSIVTTGPQDQRTRPDTFGARPPYRPLAARPDVLVFETAPLAEPVEVTGPLTAVLWVASTARDTDITVKLIDVYPPNPDYPHGYHLLLTDSILRLRYRNGDGRAELLEPGQVYRVEIPMYPTSNLFGRGHRIRLDISSSNFPRFDVNPNTGEPFGQSSRVEVAVNTIYHDREHPSHIVLPIIPGGAP